ncbi:MAG: hypothetical protein P8I03_02340 [Thalassotalea sp.]|nr:hypothetical protein [Thalassotalea sp.]
MEENSLRDPLIERRTHQNNFDELWSNLTLAQKFSASSLAKYGYELAFIRCSSSGNVAIMLLDENTTAISCDGSIDTSSDIKIR